MYVWERLGSWDLGLQPPEQVLGDRGEDAVSRGDKNKKFLAGWCWRAHPGGEDGRACGLTKADQDI